MQHHTPEHECSMTPLWKFCSCSFYPCRIMGAWTHRFTIPFHNSEFVLWQSLPKSGIYIKAYGTDMKKLLFFWTWRWRSDFSKTYKLGNILAYLVYNMGLTDNLNLYFSDIYTGNVAVKAFQTKTHLFSKQIKCTHFFTLQPTQVSCSADCMDSHVPRKMLEELMSSEMHNMIFSRSWSTFRVAENQNISSFP
jgi:hypothetical protein